MNTETIKIKYHTDEIEKLRYIDGKSDWIDLRAAEDVELKAGEFKLISLGVSMELPDGTFGAIFARSGLATKSGLRPANCVGCCDSDYRGEYIVALHNDTDIPRVVEDGERIAQLVVMPYIPVNFEEVDELSDTERGDKGFGDSGRF